MLDHTPQSVNGPLLKLLESYICRRWCFIEVETMSVLGLLVRWIGELSFSVVENLTSLGVYSVEILPEHRGGLWTSN